MPFFVPAETRLEQESLDLSLASGWLWGRGGAGLPLEITTPAATIMIEEGRFALEYQPGRTAWLYLLEGRGEITYVAAPGMAGDPIPLSGWTMMNLLDDGAAGPLEIDPTLIAAIRNRGDPSFETIWEPGLGAQIRRSLSAIGVGTGQVVTFVTYFIVFLSGIVLPIYGLYLLVKRRKDKLE